jgi:hypothetical protein
MLGRRISTDKNALLDAEFRFNVFLNQITYKRKLLKNPELSARELAKKLHREAMASLDEEQEGESSDSEIGEEDNYYTMDVSSISRSKAGKPTKKPAKKRTSKIRTAFNRVSQRMKRPFKPNSSSNITVPTITQADQDTPKPLGVFDIAQMALGFS